MASDNAKNQIQGSKVMAIITGILLVILGIVFFVFPLGSMLFVDIFITIGLLIFGVYRIIEFIAAPKGFRDGWQLAFGIILVICAIMVLASNASSIIISFAILLGLLALMVGLNQVISYGALRGMPSAAFILVSGIVNILLAIFLMFAPFMGTAVLAIVEGIYLCVAGVALIIEGFAKKPATFFDSLP